MALLPYGFEGIRIPDAFHSVRKQVEKGQEQDGKAGGQEDIGA